jgi:MoaA/NifB/PqqE/SkfB family radical SAM enzyme
MGEDQTYIRLMDHSIRSMFKDALRIVWRNPALAWFVLRMVIKQRRAARLRARWERKSVHVPPFMIVSITHRCNLHCKGCYARAQHRGSDQEMSDVQLRQLLQEAEELGISMVLLAGGEPLVRREILEVTRAFPRTVFPMFTNGLLINEEVVQELRQQKHVIPVLSMEGFGAETDQRRGEGVFDHLQKVMTHFREENIFFGVSLTLTRENYDTITHPPFIQNLMDQGCKVCFYVEYVPVQEDTLHLVLTDEQRVQIPVLMARFREEYPAIFIAFPGDEEAFGGCLAAGRGFIHVSPEGDLEPCPFAPYSDTNLQNRSLQEALASQFLQEIRGNHGRLMETSGGCALWEQRDWVQSLLAHPQTASGEKTMQKDEQPV